MTVASSTATSYREGNWDIAVAVIAILLIFYLWLSSLFYVFIPWTVLTWSENKVGWIVFFTILHIGLASSLWSFFMAAFTNPGSVPQSYRVTIRVSFECILMNYTAYHRIRQIQGDGVRNVNNISPLDVIIVLMDVTVVS